MHHFYSLPLNLQFALITMILFVIALGYLVWAGNHGIRDYLAERQERILVANKPRGATRLVEEV